MLTPSARSASRQILKAVRPATQARSDRFRGRPRRNVPERAKPTGAQRRPRTTNIRKARKTRRSLYPLAKLLRVEARHGGLYLRIGAPRGQMFPRAPMTPVSERHQSQTPLG